MARISTTEIATGIMITVSTKENFIVTCLLQMEDVIELQKQLNEKLAKQENGNELA